MPIKKMADINSVILNVENGDLEKRKGDDFHQNEEQRKPLPPPPSLPPPPAPPILPPPRLPQEQQQQHRSNNHQSRSQNNRSSALKNHKNHSPIEPSVTILKKDHNDNNQRSFDNPAYRPPDTLPYTDFMNKEDKDTPIFNGNHLIHPRTASEPTSTNTIGKSAGPKFHSFSKRNGYVLGFNNTRKWKSSRNTYYHDNHFGKMSGTAQNYIGRRMGPHHKYATTRHSPIFAYNGTRIGLANGDIRKSQSLGRSSGHVLHQSMPAMFVPTPVIYSHTPYFPTHIGNGGIDNPLMIQQGSHIPNGFYLGSRRLRNSHGEKDDEDEEEDKDKDDDADNESRRESYSTSGRDSRAGAVLNFIRHSKPGRLLERKESCVSFFDIETDKVSSYMYRPGEEITGIVKLAIRHTLEIRFVELVVTGRGHVVFRQPNGMAGKLGRTTKETYLYKRTYIIGSGDEAWSSLLTPGTYTSRFRVKLPPGLPSSLHHHDVTNGMSLDISYTIKARICDDPGPSASARSRMSSRSNRSQKQLVRILMAKQINFNVQRSFDLSTIPGAATPFTHTERVYMSCAHTQAAVVTVKLDRSVFLAGDDIKLQLATSLPHGQRLKEITCSLQEHVTLNPKQESIILQLTRMHRKDPGQILGRSANQEAGDIDAFEVTIPTQTGLVSPFSLGSSKAKIAYFLAINLKFSRSGGKLAFKFPLTIGPCAEPIYAEKTSSRKTVPVFNRPTRFPHFTSPMTAQPTKQPRSQSARPNSRQEGWPRSNSVQSKYSNSCLSRLFLCCRSTTD